MTLKEILADPTISYWFKDAIKTAYDDNRDMTVPMGTPKVAAISL